LKKGLKSIFRRKKEKKEKTTDPKPEDKPATTVAPAATTTAAAPVAEPAPAGATAPAQESAGKQRLVYHFTIRDSLIDLETANPSEIKTEEPVAPAQAPEPKVEAPKMDEKDTATDLPAVAAKTGA
jgi:hypothetical protein